MLIDLLIYKKEDYQIYCFALCEESDSPLFVYEGKSGLSKLGLATQSRLMCGIIFSRCL